MADIHSLSIQGSIVTPASADYEESIARRSATSVLRPQYIVYPAKTADITLAIQFALSQNPPLEIAVKSGGCHSSTNASTEGGIVVDLSKLKAITIADDKKTVAVQAGALWGDVYTAVENLDVSVVGGSVWFVGVGGYLTGGGYSPLSGEYGLAIDSVVSAEVVLADGKIVRCSEEDESDLFWAIRGGGNQFGIVTEFVLKTYPARGPILNGALAYPGTELNNVLKLVHDFIGTQESTWCLNLMLARAPPHFQPGITILPYIEGDQTAAEAALEPFRTKVTPVFAHIGTAHSQNAFSHGPDAFLAHAPPRAVLAGATFSKLWDDVVGWVFNEWVSFTEQEETKGSFVMFELAEQGKIASVPVGATAFPERHPHFYMIATANFTNPDLAKPSRDWVSKVAAYVKKQNEERTGIKLHTSTNFALGPEYESQEDVYGENLTRLRKVKAKYDPKKVWRRGWAIEPDNA